MKTRKQCEKIIKIVKEAHTPDNRTFEEAEADAKKQKNMKTIVEITWDEPEYEAWLCPENIKLALSSYCKNTKFEVKDASQRESKYKELYEAMKELSKNVFMQCQLCPPKTHTKEFELKEFKLREDKLRQNISELEKELNLNI